MEKHQAGKRRQGHPQRCTVIRNARWSISLHRNVIETKEVVIVTILKLKRARRTSCSDVRGEERITECSRIRLSDGSNDYAVEGSRKRIDESAARRAVIGQIIGDRIHRAGDRAECLTQGAGVWTGAEIRVVGAGMCESRITADVGEIARIGERPRREGTGFKAAILNAFCTVKRGSCRGR